DRSSFELLAQWSGFEQPGDVLESGDGSLIVAETGTGRLLHVSGPDGTERRVVAAGLESPHGLAWSDDGSVFVSETDAGRLLRVDVDSGRSEVVASGLRGPEGVAVDREGRVLVIEVGAQRLQRFDPESGTGTIVATDLPIGLSDGPSLYRGLAVGDAGIYFSSDVDNTIYRVRAAD